MNSVLDTEGTSANVQKHHLNRLVIIAYTAAIFFLAATILIKTN